jgi:hypothetical protein
MHVRFASILSCQPAGGSLRQPIALSSHLAVPVAFCTLIRNHECGTSTHRPGVWKPQTKLWHALRVLKIPYAFAVGEPATYVQAPKAKGRRSRASFGFPTPRSRVLGQFAGAHRKRFFPESGRGAEHVPFIPYCVAFRLPRQFSVLERNLCLFVRRHTLSQFLESYEHRRIHARTRCSGHFATTAKSFYRKLIPLTA